MSKKTIEVLGTPVLVRSVGENDYISLTDIAKSDTGKKPSNLISNWMQNQKTLLFLQTWEEVNNPDFNVLQMQDIRMRAVSERYMLSPQKYIDATDAIGITSTAGRYGGTFAHVEIALAFAYWLEPSFQVYFLTEFNRMKKEETALLENTKKWAFEKLLRGAEEFQSVARLGVELMEGQTEEE